MAGRVDIVASSESRLRRLTRSTQRLRDLSPRVIRLPRLHDHLGQNLFRLDFDGRQSPNGFQGFSQQVRGLGRCLAEVERVDRVLIVGTCGRIRPACTLGSSMFRI